MADKIPNVSRVKANIQPGETGFLPLKSLQQLPICQFPSQPSSIHRSVALLLGNFWVLPTENAALCLILEAEPVEGGRLEGFREQFTTILVLFNNKMALSEAFRSEMGLEGNKRR